MLALHYMTNASPVTLDDVAAAAHAAGLTTSTFVRGSFRSVIVEFPGAARWYWSEVPREWVAGELGDNELELIAKTPPSHVFVARVHHVPAAVLLPFLRTLIDRHGGAVLLEGRRFDRASLPELSRCLDELATVPGAHGSREDQR